MKLANVALVSTMAVLGLVAVGCASKNASSGESLGDSQSLLVTDNSESTEADDTMESGVEEPLSGADPSNPGTPVSASDDASLVTKVKANVGKWFQPAGCITSVFAGNVATHTFKGCTGPYGLVDFNGVITSTYTRTDTSLTIVHAATGFKANGAAIDGSRTVVYTLSGDLVTKHRTGSWSGTTRLGKAFSHEADFTATWDPTTKCITRDGTAETTIAARNLSLTITGYKRCGIGMDGCPEAGTITLERTRGVRTNSATLTFEGGPTYVVTGPEGNSVKQELVCTE